MPNFQTFCTISFVFSKHVIQKLNQICWTYGSRERPLWVGCKKTRQPITRALLAGSLIWLLQRIVNSILRWIDTIICTKRHRKASKTTSTSLHAFNACCPIGSQVFCRFAQYAIRIRPQLCVIQISTSNEEHQFPYYQKKTSYSIYTASPLQSSIGLYITRKVEMNPYQHNSA